MRKRPLFFNVLYIEFYIVSILGALTPENCGFSGRGKKAPGTHSEKSHFQQFIVTSSIRIHQCTDFQNLSQGRAGSHVNVHVLREGVAQPIELRLVRHFKARRSGMPYTRFFYPILGLFYPILGLF
jgi:hypothetical protein